MQPPAVVGEVDERGLTGFARHAQPALVIDAEILAVQGGDWPIECGQREAMTHDKWWLAGLTEMLHRAGAPEDLRIWEFRIEPLASVLKESCHGVRHERRPWPLGGPKGFLDMALGHDEGAACRQDDARGIDRAGTGRVAQLRAARPCALEERVLFAPDRRAARDLDQRRTDSRDPRQRRQGC